MQTNQNTDHNQRIKVLRKSMIFGYTGIIIIVIFLISVLAMNKTDEVLKSKVSSMASALTVQMKMNINSYLSKMETTCALVFVAEEVYQYDATDTSVDGYEALSTEKIISDKLFDLCIMENFVDFGIVYRNNHVVGKVSNGTIELFGEMLYTDLEAMINRSRTHDGWATGYNGDFRRIYYVKQVNENAVLVTSFYTTELEEVFEHPGGMGDMTVRLLEENDIVIYSSVDGETGNPLDPEIGKRISAQTSVTSMDKQYLINVNSCGDNWRVICSIPTQIILREKNEVQIFIVIVSLILALAAMLITIWLSHRISKPVNRMVKVLDKEAHIDQLTGVLNKRSFEESADRAFNLDNSPEKYALILIDVDNFKGVNDTLGHMYGDRVLAGIGDILHEVFRADDFLGRLGGDEFCVLLYLPNSATSANLTEYTSEKCRQLCEAFRNNYTGDDGKYKVSASIGVAFFPTHGTTFTKLYQCADKALYESKRKGKDTYTIYGEE
ncbi:MAG: GGDEF domain-containing protein [Oscillospiraceae bacterium]|nr:GGDEF domain-containing protein [Oscillospiraceae bacterium]